MKVHQKLFVEMNSFREFIVFESQKHEFKQFEYLCIELEFSPSYDTIETVVIHSLRGISIYE